MVANQALLGAASAFIFETFVMSKREAEQLAADYVDLIQAKGGDPSGLTFEELRPLIIRRVSETHEWRDERKKQRAALDQEKNTNAYEQFIEKGRSSPFKKW